VLLVLTFVVRVVDMLVGVDATAVVVEEVFPALLVVLLPALVVAAPPDPVTGVPDAVILEEACVIETAPL
jgi:hypothetical protein